MKLDGFDFIDIIKSAKCILAKLRDNLKKQKDYDQISVSTEK